MLSINRVRHELKFREIELIRAHDVTPGLRSLTFGGESLAGFVTASFDDHMKLLFPKEPGGRVVPPEITPQGLRFVEPAPLARDFTPRAFDPVARELVLEFALHPEGIASDFARAAKPGDRLMIGGPRGSLVIPLGYEWHVLLGDESALPAIARRLEELPAGARAQVVIETHSPSDRRPLPSAAQVELRWIEASESALANALASMSVPSGEGFVWAAGEAASMRLVRNVLRERHGIAASHSRVSAYWKRGAQGHHEDLE